MVEDIHGVQLRTNFVVRYAIDIERMENMLSQTRSTAISSRYFISFCPGLYVSIMNESMNEIEGKKLLHTNVTVGLGV